MVKQAFTIHHVMNEGRFGYESTHAYRHQVFETLGISHTVIYTEIPNYDCANWVESLEGKGIPRFYHVILDLSTIARDVPSLSLNDIFSDDIPNTIERVVYHKNGCVGQIIYHTGKREFYTSGLFLSVIDESKFELFDHASMILSGEIGKADEYIMSSVKSQIDYLLEFLAEKSQITDIFIMDKHDYISGKIKRFFKVTNRQLYRVIHFNVLSPLSKTYQVTWGKQLAASEPLANVLTQRGEETVFIPPVVFLESCEVKVYEKLQKWCLVGNASVVKRVEMAIDVFSKLEEEYPNIRLDIYGQLPYNVSLPKNITYKGLVDNVPYEEYEGYLSCSMTELFANAMVEASHIGLVCLVSNVDIAHKYYASLDSSVQLFLTAEELYHQIVQLSVTGGKSASFTNRYTLKYVQEIYREVFGV